MNDGELRLGVVTEFARLAPSILAGTVTMEECALLADDLLGVAIGRASLGAEIAALALARGQVGSVAADKRSSLADFEPFQITEATLPFLGMAQAVGA